MVSFKSGLLLRAMPEFIVLQQQLMSTASITSGGRVDDWGLVSYPRSLSMSEDHAAAITILIWVACAATLGHGDVWARTAAEDHVWVHGLAVIGFCDDAHGLGYHEWSLETHCGELTPPFTGPGIAGPAPLWILQQESWPCSSG